MPPATIFFSESEATHERTGVATIEEIKTASLEELKAIPKIAYQKWFKDWKKRWLKCIIYERDYFEESNINIDE